MASLDAGRFFGCIINRSDALKSKGIYMAEEVHDPSSDNGDTTTDEKTDVNKGSGTFTQEQLGEKLSEERKKLRKQFEAEKKQAVDEALAEYERKSKLSEEERQKEAYSEREKSLAEREQALVIRELRSGAVAELQARKLPVELVDSVVGKDEEETKANIEALESAWRSSLDEAVKAKLGNTTPSDRSKRTTTRDEMKIGRDNGAGIYSF